MSVRRMSWIVMVGAVTLVVLSAMVGSAAGSGRHYCGHFRARGYTLYAYVTRGHVSCGETRRVLKAWFIDAHHTQHYGRWFCADSLGPALAAGEIQHCSTHGARIADYMNRV